MRLGSNDFSTTLPIYQVFEHLAGVGAAYTGKGGSRDNYHFSFQRSEIDHAVLADNLEYYSRAQGFDLAKITWPNGAWPHSGVVIIAEEEHTWVPSLITGGIVPLNPTTGERVVYDGIATKSKDYVLGVQGADCPSLFLYDPDAHVIGLAHAGWKPTVRGVVSKTVKAMTELGATPASIRAFIGPGAGHVYEFQWDEAMEPGAREIFVAAGREDLLTDRSVRYKMNESDRNEVRMATGRDIKGGTTFMLSSLIARDLEQAGVKRENVGVSELSTICARYPGQGTENILYQFHSARRDAGKDPERPAFGSNLCVLFLKEKA